MQKQWCAKSSWSLLQNSIDTIVLGIKSTTSTHSPFSPGFIATMGKITDMISQSGSRLVDHGPKASYACSHWIVDRMEYSMLNTVVKCDFWAYREGWGNLPHIFCIWRQRFICHGASLPDWADANVNRLCDVPSSLKTVSKKTQAKYLLCKLQLILHKSSPAGHVSLWWHFGSMCRKSKSSWKSFRLKIVHSVILYNWFLFLIVGCL